MFLKRVSFPGFSLVLFLSSFIPFAFLNFLILDLGVLLVIKLSNCDLPSFIVSPCFMKWLSCIRQQCKFKLQVLSFNFSWAREGGRKLILSRQIFSRLSRIQFTSPHYNINQENYRFNVCEMIHHLGPVADAIKYNDRKCVIRHK